MSNEANCDLNSFLENCAFWAVWQEWGNCSEECDIGSRNRKRGCSGIGECQGDSSESENCNTDPCACWEQWQSWTARSASCGDGLRKRKRNCLGSSSSEEDVQDRRRNWPQVFESFPTEDMYNFARVLPPRSVRRYTRIRDHLQGRIRFRGRVESIQASARINHQILREIQEKY
ncbi:unnamed protein product [Oikopleura dioica]|uniref:Spondin-like TSP1 domain-containing protein n=1 Tax=Oikopleura dioica TaxID=34765 RepID=E4Y2C2_OIKDI|nr:unnamed protein product [Oikopleura dioica]